MGSFMVESFLAVKIMINILSQTWLIFVIVLNFWQPEFFNESSEIECVSGSLNFQNFQYRYYTLTPYMLNLYQVSLHFSITTSPLNEL